MDIKVINDVGTFSISLLSGLLIVVAAIGIGEPQKAFGQAEEVFSENATFAQEMEGGSPPANQTAAPTPPQEVASQNLTDIFTLPSERGTQNQNTATGGSISPTGQTGTQNQTQMALANLTRADFAFVTGALDSARDSILVNSSQDAYTSLNDADDELFKTALAKGPSAMITIIEISDPMRSHIENAQKALLDGDLPNALKERNSAEVELVRLTQGLPAGEEEPPADEEEPPADEAEPSTDEEE
jgi:hypothetical protein